MAIIPGPLGDGSTGNGISSSQNVFALYGPAGIAPFYVPQRFEVGKERNLDKEEAFCEGEDVTDMGGKNRDIHVSGVLLDSEIDAFNALLDSGEEHELIMPAWSGEVFVEDGNIDGPRGTDSKTREWLYRFTLNLVSTGLDETGPSDDGILSEGQIDPVPDGLAQDGSEGFVGL